VNKSLINIAILSLLILMNSCDDIDEIDDFFYNIHDEDELYILPNVLNEISGIEYIENDKLYCINDEDGILFVYDLSEEKIINEISFGKSGDYEDLAIIDSLLYVLKSNGTIYRFNIYSGEIENKAEKINSKLHKTCDAEGLCYDRENNRLLIACKGSAGNVTIYKFKKAIYSFDLTTNTLEAKPVYIIDNSEIQELKNTGNTQKAYDKFASVMGGENTTFNPSAIAIHPITGDIYILSSVGKLLLVMSSNGTIHYTISLKRSKFKQPEGLTFDKNGAMYISNEGRGGKANIKVFNYKLNSSINE
jgi:uncharacterized protein YjiK